MPMTFYLFICLLKLIIALDVHAADYDEQRDRETQAKDEMYRINRARLTFIMNKDVDRNSLLTEYLTRRESHFEAMREMFGCDGAVYQEMERAAFCTAFVYNDGERPTTAITTENAHHVRVFLHPDDFNHSTLEETKPKPYYRIRALSKGFFLDDNSIQSVGGSVLEGARRPDENVKGQDRLFEAIAHEFQKKFVPDVSSLFFITIFVFRLSVNSLMKLKPMTAMKSCYLLNNR